MADPTQPQQQPQQGQPPQSGGIMSSIGSALSSALPYALPALLGAGIGGLGGAAAGVGMGAEGLQESQEKDADLAAKQQDIALRWQEYGLEKQKVQMAMQGETAFQNYAKSQPDAQRNLLLALPPDQRGDYLNKQLSDQQWHNNQASLTSPASLQHLGLSSADLNWAFTLPKDVGMPLMEGMMKAAQANNLQQVKFIQSQALQQMKDSAAAGRVDTAQAGANARNAASIGAADTRAANALSARGPKAPSVPMLSNMATKAVNDAKATTDTGFLGTTVGASDSDRRAAATTNFVKQLTGPPYNMDPAAAEDLANRYVGPKFSGGTTSPSTTDKGGANVSLPSNITTTSAALKYLTMKKGMSTEAAKAWIRQHAAD